MTGGPAPTPRALLIDVPRDRLEAAVAFWSGALGATPRWPDDPDDPYVPLDGAASRLEVALQATDDTARYHLDLPADDVDAAADRLVAAGAARVERHDEHWVLADPAGLPFCVIPAGVDVAPTTEAAPGQGRLDAVFVDVPPDHVDAEVAFWAAALGASAGDGETYVPLEGVRGRGGPLTVEVQRLGDGPPRYHVDLSADDVEEEAARLEGIGARRVRAVEDWVTLADPVGNLVCVVPRDEGTA